MSHMNTQLSPTARLFIINGNTACYGKPITSLCRELRDSMNMYKRTQGEFSCELQLLSLSFRDTVKCAYFYFLEDGLR